LRAAPKPDIKDKQSEDVAKKVAATSQNAAQIEPPKVNRIGRLIIER
jgi:hypothetical protein